MPFITRLKKSGSKRVYDQSHEGYSGQLNEAARDVFAGRPPQITQGPAGLKDPLYKDQTNLLQQAMIRQRRRRSLASVSRANNRRAAHRRPH